MKNSETGEYELVVGNRQVVSAFFIVALLCGVFFALGYVVGSNLPRGAKLQPDAAIPASTATPPADSRPTLVTLPQGSTANSQPPADAAAQKPAESAGKPPDPEPPPQPTTQAARETPQSPPAVADAGPRLIMDGGAGLMVK